MPASKGVQSVVYNPDGSVAFGFTDGTGREFSSVAAMQAFAAGVVTDELLGSLLIARFKGQNPAMTDPSKVNGVVLEIDMASVLNPVAFGSV